MSGTCARLRASFAFARSLAAAVVVAGLAGALAAPPALAAQKCVVPDLTWRVSDDDKVRTGELLRDMGAKRVRMQLDWNWLDAEPELLADYDKAVDTARAAGARVTLIASQTPSWASGTQKPEAPPLDPRDYADWLGPLVEHFRGRVDSYEIWNEEDTLNFWPSGPDAEAYVALLKAGSAAVRAADPSARVVFGGMAGSNYAFLQQAYAVEPDLGEHFDALAVHPYVIGGLPPDSVTFDLSGRIDRWSFTGYRELRKLMLAHGDQHPIWITEFGYATTTTLGWLGGVTEAVQADYLTRAFALLEQDPYVEVMCWYNLRNNFWAPEWDTWEDQLGLVRAGFEPKLAYHAFKAYVPPPGTAPEDPPAAPPGTVPEDPPAAVPQGGAEPTATPAPTAAPPVQPATARPPVADRAGTKIVLRVRRARAARSSRLAVVTAHGRVAGVHRGVVHVELAGRARDHGAGLRRQRRTARVGRDGRFTLRVRVARRARWRVSARFSGSAAFLPGASGVVVVTT